jgi:hypothetical protein
MKKFLRRVNPHGGNRNLGAEKPARNDGRDMDGYVFPSRLQRKRHGAGGWPALVPSAEHEYPYTVVLGIRRGNLSPAARRVSSRLAKWKRTK